MVLSQPPTGAHGVTGPAPVDPRASPRLAPFDSGGCRVPEPLAPAYVRRMTHHRALRIAGVLTSVAALAGCAIGGGERVGGDPAAETSVVTMVSPFGNSEHSELAHEVSRLSGGRLELRVVATGHNGHRLRSGHDQGCSGRPRRPRDGRRTCLGRVRRTGHQRGRRTVPRRQLRTPGARPHTAISSRRCSQSCRPAWWGSVSCPGRCVARSAWPTHWRLPATSATW